MSSPHLSLTGKRWTFTEKDRAGVNDLSHALSVDPVVAEILYLRGIREKEEGEAFLESRLDQLNNPSEIPGIEKAADRVIQAIHKKEKICVYGDYDVDGVTATSLMVLVLKTLKADVFYLLPNRMTHGYGLHPDTVQQAKERGADLVVTVDNGISAVQEVALARSLGMDVIITDHHEPPHPMPETPFIVNPKAGRGTSSDNNGPGGDHFANLAGVGIAFALLIVIRARLRESGDYEAEALPNLRAYLDLVALGTIGDVVPLSGENRVLVHHGLHEIGRSRNPGLRALMRVSGLEGRAVTPGQVGFMLAPRINAAGRLGDAGLALRLLVSSDPREVDEIAAMLDQENEKRQTIEKKILDQALEQIESRGRAGDPVIVLDSDEWHPGVIGIVASRIVDRYYRPTIMIATQEGVGTGSGRSIPGFSLHEALLACQEELLGFGGHQMAAGMRLAQERIHAFRECINRYAGRVLKPETLIPSLRVDSHLDTDQVTDRLLQDLEKLKPFGMGNPEPVFLSRNVKIKNPSLAGEKHLRFQIPVRNGFIAVIGFQLKDYLPFLEKGTPMNLLYHLRYNDYNGSRTIQAVLMDLMPTEESDGSSV